MDRAVYRRSYNIGYFFWELDKIPACHYLALEMLDEIWVSSEYNRATYAQYTNLPVVNVGMPVEDIGVLTAPSRAYFGIPEGAFVFLSTFNSFSFIERKNPLAVIKAFREAFPNAGEDVALVLKTQNRFKVDDLHQRKLWSNINAYCHADKRIIVINETFSYSELLSFKRLADCYVSLHRSEGWGFGLIEAMQLGVPVITTAYSGNMEFCNDQTAYLVDYDLVSPSREEYIFVERDSRWAEPRTSSAANCMRRVINERSHAKALASAASANVSTAFSVAAISRRYAKRLSEIE